MTSRVEMETDLQMDIDQTEENYPGYDEYRYNIGEIRLLGLMRGLGILPLDFLLLYPLGEGIFAPQLRVVPEGSLRWHDLLYCHALRVPVLLHFRVLYGE